jgi:glycosyltransferase involved in cell wall biosynthesis
MSTMPVEKDQVQNVQSIERARDVKRSPLLSVVTPAYNEEGNLPILYERLSNALVSIDIDWEWIVVDDHSSDRTFTAIGEIAARDPRVHAVRFARNFGSHTAITCGLYHARGDCAVIMAADLQDPPEVLSVLLEKWFAKAQVVWAVRTRREGEKTSTIGYSRLYYLLMRHVVGLKEMPPTGADFFLVDRYVLDAFRQFKESNVSIMALISWMGFRQETITYDKQARLHGNSGWTLKKKLKLLVDSVTSFTYLPIRIMSYVGFLVALAGFVYAGIVVGNSLAGHPVEGWSSLMVAILVIGGIQMLMMGVLGEYLWRALDESRSRPRYLIEATTNVQADNVRKQSHG